VPRLHSRGHVLGGLCLDAGNARGVRGEGVYQAREVPRRVLLHGQKQEGGGQLRNADIILIARFPNVTSYGNEKFNLFAPKRRPHQTLPRWLPCWAS